MTKSITGSTAKQIHDSQKRLKTLSNGLYSFEKKDLSLLFCNTELSAHKKNRTPKKILFLGLGYNMEHPLALSGCAQDIYYLECPLFEKACRDADIVIPIPHNFIKISEDNLYSLLSDEMNKDTSLFLTEWTIYVYKQNTQLFPLFWNAVLLNIDDIFTDKTQKNAPQKRTPQKATSKTIFVAGSSRDLVFRELCDALQSLQYEYITFEQNDDANFTAFTRFIKEQRPTLFLSINGRNLDSNGKIYALLQKLRIPIALWFLDNPWNILSAYKEDWWKYCSLYVTDASFIPQLEAHGAERVYSLPLAASNKTPTIGTNPFLSPCSNEPFSPKRSLLYVGHSAFDKKAQFFSAAKSHSDLLKQQKQVLLQDYKSQNTVKSPINFHTLCEDFFHNQSHALWPKNDVRIAAYLSAELDNFQKVYWLEQLSQRIYLVGDKGWDTLLSQKIPRLPQVDYYRELPSYYYHSPFTLNITSLLMPSALTQRHFDVWMCNGFLLTSPSGGLNIFPEHLIKTITVNAPSAVNESIDYYQKNPAQYTEIKKEMQTIIHQSNLYSHRINTLLSHI